MMKKTAGRKKIEIKRIEKTANRLVAFSKRRPGLFNKASELCILTGAEMAILVQSEGGRVFAFAHPSADSVIDTYLGNNVSNSSPTSENLSYMHEEYKKEYEKICKELEVEKNKSNSVEESDGFWWENSVENLEVDELEIFINSLEQLKLNVTKKADELRTLSASSSSNNIIDGLLDEFLSDNIGIADEDLMMSAGNYNSNNHDDQHNDRVNNLQVQGNVATFRVSDDLCFGPDHIQSDEHNDGVNNLHVQGDVGTFRVLDDLCFGPDQIQSDGYNDRVNNLQVQSDVGTFRVTDSK